MRSGSARVSAAAIALAGGLALPCVPPASGGLGEPAAPAAATLWFRFVGNSAFEISDGESTLLTDFPYRSGAFDYMTFPSSELRRRERALCLFTHRHGDHFDPAALAEVGCAVAGPREVMAAAAEAVRLGAGPTWKFGGATIRCLPTSHADVEHCSYLVEWHGRRWFVSGDVEDLAGLDGLEGPLDAVFLPAWLASDATARDAAKRLGARLVVHHHTAGQTLTGCIGCLVPAQGSTFTLR